MRLLLLLLAAGAFFYYGLNKESLQDRPAFEVVHNGVTPISCNLAYKENRKVVKTTTMMLHDYFRKADGKYYFAVSVDDRKFLLGALEVVKTSTSADDLRKAKAFATLCKNFDGRNSPSIANDSSTLTAKELEHIKRSVKEVRLKADVFKQQGRLLEIYENYRRPNQSKIYQKHLKTLYLIEGDIRQPYPHDYLTVWTSRSVSRNGGEAGYCLSYELALYHAKCQYFEDVKKRDYTGIKPPSSNAF